jgi:hypothetical protein
MTIKRDMRKHHGAAGMKRPASRLELAAGFDALVARVKQLEEKLRHVSEREAWCGIWRDGGDYPKGVFATCDGALWCALRDTDRKPGTPDCGWALMVKTHGRPR